MGVSNVCFFSLVLFFFFLKTKHQSCVKTAFSIKCQARFMFDPELSAVPTLTPGSPLSFFTEGGFNPKNLLLYNDHE